MLTHLMVLFEHAWESTAPFYLQPFHMTFSLVLFEHACRDKNTLSTRFDGTLQCIVDILSISSNAWDLIMAKPSILSFILVFEKALNQCRLYIFWQNLLFSSRRKYFHMGLGWFTWNVFWRWTFFWWTIGLLPTLLNNFHLHCLSNWHAT